MKFKKVVIGGVEYYQPLEDMPKRGRVKIEITEVEEHPEKKSFLETVKDGTTEFIDRVGTGAKTLGTKIAVGAKDLGQRIKESGDRFFGRDKTMEKNSREEKLIKLLPYMSKKEIHEMAEGIIADDAAVASLDLMSVLPFLTKDDCDKLFERAVRVGNTAYDFAKTVPYVSRGCLSGVVDGYINGEYPELDIDSLYPFLSDEDIRRIFHHVLNSEQ